MSRFTGPFALMLALLILAAAPSAALVLPAGLELPGTEESPAEAVAEAASSLCQEHPEPSFGALPAVPAGNHGEEGREIQCNVECDSFGDDCSHICGPGSGLCLPLALASGLCFFCQC